MRKFQKKTPKIKKINQDKSSQQGKITSSSLKASKLSKKIKKPLDKTSNREKFSSLYERAQNLYNEKVAFLTKKTKKLLLLGEKTFR